MPDRFLRGAHQIEVVDLAPQVLRDRLAEGLVYPAERVDAALSHYFRLGNLTALRELALLRAIRVGRARDWALLGMALALGGLAKGPVILIHLGSALALSPLWSAGRITWRTMTQGAGIALGTGLALPSLRRVRARIRAMDL